MAGTRIQKIGIFNWKCFKNESEFDLSHITLLAGKNSSGKSSLIKALLTFLQTQRFQTLKEPSCDLVLNGPLVENGPAESILNDVNKPLKFSFYFSMSDRTDVERESGGNDITGDFVFSANLLYKNAPKGLGLTGFRFNYDDGADNFGNYCGSCEYVRNGAVYVESARLEGKKHLTDFAKGAVFPENARIITTSSIFELIENWVAQLQGLFNRGKDKPIGRSKDIISIVTHAAYSYIQSSNQISEDKDAVPDWVLRKFNDNYEEICELMFKRLQDSTLKEIPAEKYYGFDYYVWHIDEKIKPTIAEPFRDFSARINSIVYIGPLRSKPQQVYQFSEVYGNAYDSANIYVVEEIYRLIQEKRKSELVKILYALGLAKGIDVIRHGFGYELLIEPMGIDRKVHINDMGFGFSQILPILVFSITKSDSVIIIEQPELHLHPDLQFRLGQYLGKISRKNGNQYIIETHSDHIVNAIRLAITKRELKKEDVRMYFANDPGDFRSVEVDESGSFADWPAGFFDQASKISEQIFIASLKKRHGKQ